jgi:hypothetical protein
VIPTNLRRLVLTHTAQLHLNATERELQDRRHSLDTLDHASANSGEQQLGRIEGIRPTTHICVERDFSLLAACNAAVGVDTLSSNTIFEHG